MRDVIISSDYKNLKQLLESSKEEYCYILLNDNFSDIEDFLEKRGYQKVDIRRGLQNIDFRMEYIDFIGRLNRHYNSIYWLANSVSYKGTFVSNLYHEIYYYYCLISLIRMLNTNLIIISSNFLLNRRISKYCVENGVKCMLLKGKKEKNKAVHFKRYLLANLYFLFKGWKTKFFISLYLSKKIEKSLKEDTPYYVVRSWIDKGSFPSNGTYRDLYFGSLPEYLKRKGKESVVLVGSLTNYKQLIAKIKRIEDFLLVPQEYFIGYLDYLKVMSLAFIKRPKVEKQIMFCNLDITDLVKQCLDKDYENNEINSNLIYYYYIKGLLKKIKIENFIYVFENKAWERITILALRKYSPSTKITGYMHSSIRQSSLGYFQSKEEKDIIPSPDKVLTVGEEPMLMLARSGGYSTKVELSEGCALRYEHFFRNKRIERRKEGKVLVTFPIDSGCSLKLFRFLNDAFSGKYKYKILLRSHPFAPIETLIGEYNLRLNNNFEISKNLALEQDLGDACVLIYVDSTSSMEALMRGTPAIHIDFKESLNQDPLFNLNSLKWIVSNKEELLSAIDYIYNMDEEEYLIKYNEAIFYLKRYFRPIEERYLEKFIS